MRAHGGFTLVEMLIVVSIIILAMMIAMPMLAGFVQASSLDRVSDIVGSVLSAGRSTAVSQHKFVAVYVDKKGDIRLHRWPKDDGVPPVGVGDASGDEWEQVRGVRSWRVFESVVVLNGETPWRTDFNTSDDVSWNDHLNTEVIVLIAPNGMVMNQVDAMPVSGGGSKQPSVVSFRVFTKAEIKDKKGTLSDSGFKAFVETQGRVLYIDRITAQILKVPGGDDMITDPVYADP